MALQDAEEIVVSGLDIPIGRKVYHVEEPSAREGLRLQIMFHNPDTSLDDLQELREIKRLLGPVWDQMNDDGVGWSKMVHAGRTALFKYGLGDENASIFWHGGLEALGKGLNPQPQRDLRESAGVVVARVSRRVSQARMAQKTRAVASGFLNSGSVGGLSISKKRRRFDPDRS